MMSLHLHHKSRYSISSMTKKRYTLALMACNFQRQAYLQRPWGYNSSEKAFGERQKTCFFPIDALVVFIDSYFSWFEPFHGPCSRYREVKVSPYGFVCTHYFVMAEYV